MQMLDVIVNRFIYLFISVDELFYVTVPLSQPNRRITPVIHSWFGWFSSRFSVTSEESKI
jgi:hypothetical protein